MTMETAAQSKLLPEVREFLKKEIHGAVIGGLVGLLAVAGLAILMFG